MLTKYLRNLEIDLYQLTWDIVSQIPVGKVATFGGVARALGDIRASRAVSVILNSSDKPEMVPEHRVVYSDGSITAHAHGHSQDLSNKLKLLKTEGVGVRNKKVLNFDERLVSEFHVSGIPLLEKLKHEQKEMRKLVSLNDLKPIDDIRLVVGVDVSYSDTHGFGGAVVLDISSQKIIEQAVCKTEFRFPYIPTYLSYHELPIAFQLLNELNGSYDAVLFDGNGVLHPQGLGLAAHAGVILQTPTFGVAKRLLCGYMELTGKDQKTNEVVYNILFNSRLVGIGYKPKTARKRAIYISPGNMMRFITSYHLTRRLCKSRIPEPIKHAHRLALEYRRKCENDQIKSQN